MLLDGKLEDNFEISSKYNWNLRQLQYSFESIRYRRLLNIVPSCEVYSYGEQRFERMCRDVL